MPSSAARASARSMTCARLIVAPRSAARPTGDRTVAPDRSRAAYLPRPNVGDTSVQPSKDSPSTVASWRSSSTTTQSTKATSLSRAPLRLRKSTLPPRTVTSRHVEPQADTGDSLPLGLGPARPLEARLVERAAHLRALEEAVTLGVRAGEVRPLESHGVVMLVSSGENGFTKE